MNCMFQFNFFVKQVQTQLIIEFIENQYVIINIVPNISKKERISIELTIASLIEYLQEDNWFNLLDNIKYLHSNQLSLHLIRKIKTILSNCLDMYQCNLSI